MVCIKKSKEVKWQFKYLKKNYSQEVNYYGRITQTKIIQEPKYNFSTYIKVPIKT
jgi:hypothetical protein